MKRVIFFLSLVLVIGYFLKRYHNEDPEASLSELTSIGLLAELCAEAVFQLIREYIMYDDPSEPKRIFEYFLLVIGSTVLAGIISFYIAGRLKQNGITRIISLLLLIGPGFAYRSVRGAGGL